jgi:hypothetical protein
VRPPGWAGVRGSLGGQIASPDRLANWRLAIGPYYAALHLLTPVLTPGPFANVNLR